MESVTQMAVCNGQLVVLTNYGRVFCEVSSSEGGWSEVSLPDFSVGHNFDHIVDAIKVLSDKAYMLEKRAANLHSDEVTRLVVGVKEACDMLTEKLEGLRSES